MRRLRRPLTALIFLLPLAILVGFGVTVILRYYRTAEQDLTPILEAEASRALGHEVRVQRVTIRNGHAYIDNVQIAQGRTLAQHGAIATARRVIADLDLRKILLTRQLPTPLLGNVRVIDPTARVVRDAHGAWNFADLLRPQTGPRRPSPVGAIDVVNGTLDYMDFDMPRNARRQNAPIRLHVERLNGAAAFHADHTVDWRAAAIGAGGAVAGFSSLGSYDPSSSRLYLVVNIDRAAAALANRFLPSGTDLTAGLVSGRLSLLGQPGPDGRYVADYHVNADVAGGAVRTDRAAEPVTGIRASATVTRDLATVRADGSFAGSLMHVEGTILDFANPAFDGWASGTAIQTRRLASALGIARRYPALRPLAGLQATAAIRANVRGSGSAVSVAASGPGTVFGRLPGGVAAPQAGQVQIGFSGPLDAPRIAVSGAFPIVTYRDYTARNVRLSAFYSPKQAAVDFTGTVAGGSAAGRVNVTPAGRRTTWSALVRARGVDLGALPLATGSAATREHVRGVVDADVAAAGRADQRWPAAHTVVRASGLRYGEWAFAHADAEIDSAGSKAYVRRLTASDPKGQIYAAGTVDLNSRTADLAVDADRVDLAALPVALRPPAPKAVGPPAPPDRSAAPIQAPGTPPDRLAGTVYVRGGTVHAVFGKSPAFRASGQAYAYNLRSGKFGVDYAVADLSATLDTLIVRSATAYRLPAIATLAGTVQGLRTPDPQIDLVGTVSDLDTHDLLALADSDFDASGTLSGSFTLAGSLRMPVLDAPAVQVASARVGAYPFQSVSAALRYDSHEAGGTWYVDRLTAELASLNRQGGGPAGPSGSAAGAGDRASAARATLAANGSITADGHFRVSAQATNIDLRLLDRHLYPYAAILGTADLGAVDLAGRLHDGKAEDLTGTVTARTAGLTLNGVSFGDLHGLAPGAPAAFVLHDNLVTSSDLVLGSRETGLYLQPPSSPAGAPYLRYDFQTHVVSATAGIAGLPFEKLQEGLIRSPYVALHPEDPVADYVRRGISPLEGTLAGAVLVSGTFEEPQADLTWTSERARIADQNVQTFEGRVVVDRHHVALSGAHGLPAALLRADATQADASGTVFFATDASPGSVNGTATVARFPLSLIDRWFPGRTVLRDLSGDGESIQVIARGSLEAPFLTASVVLQNVLWQETTPIPGTAAAKPKQAVATNVTPAAVTTPASGPTAPPTYVIRYDASGHPVQAATTGRELRIDRIEVTQATVNDPATPNELHVQNVRLVASEPPTAPTPVTAAAARSRSARSTRAEVATPAPPPAPLTHVVTASGWVEFDGHSMQLPDDPAVDVRVAIDRQSLGIVRALVPTEQGVQPAGLARAVLAGSVAANVHYFGHVQEPNAEGGLLIDADRLRFADMTTELRAVHGDFEFAGNALRVAAFTAMPVVINPRTQVPAATPDPKRVITMTGELPLTRRGAPGTPAAPGITITLNHLRVAEAPLPTMSSGRFVSDDLTGLVTVTGSLRRPVVAGTIGTDQTDFRMPDTFVAGTSGAALPFEPTFHLNFTVGSKTRVSAAMMTASVHTPAGRPVTLNGSPGRLALDGTLVVDSGTITFPLERFTIVRGGTVTLRYPAYAAGNYGEPDVSVDADISAVTRLTAVSATGTRRRYTITATVRGPINSGAPLALGTQSDGMGVGLFGERRLQVAFSADPPDLAYSDAVLQQRVAGLLGGQDAIESLFSRNADVGTVLRSQLTSALSNSLIPSLFDRLGIGNALGFEELTVDVDPFTGLMLHVTRQVFGPVYVTYERLLTGTATEASSEGYGWRFEVSYRVPTRLMWSSLQLSWAINSLNANEYLFGGVFRF